MIKILNSREIGRDEIFARTVSTADVSDIVADIIYDVRKNKDKALLAYTEKFDGARLESLLVSPAEIEEAISLTDPALLEIIKEAAENIREFHSKQISDGYLVNNKNGVVTGQKVMPVDRAGIYVPGGTAAYPSTVLMNAIPAKLAGCKEVVMVTPPDKNGKITPAVLAAASITGVDKIFKVGGAQAVAALAYGTESIPQVDKIVGPGNIFVAEAKKQVFGRVSIDMIAGPSEILIIADGDSNPAHIAADLLSQAEHDKLASAVLVTPSPELAKKVSDELERQIPLLERAEIARTSIDNNGKIIVSEALDDAFEISNEIAPEHLELFLDNPFDYLDRIRHAGSVFMGKNTPEALGDYFAGPNHTLPTSGTAKFSSALSVSDFVKKTQYIYYSKEALSKVAGKVETFAKSEGLTAHAKSAVIRFEE